MCSGKGDRTRLLPGFPIRKSSDQSSVGSSPRLIAASYVLHRLLGPRHPPCALTSLATKMLPSTVQFSRCGRSRSLCPPPAPGVRCGTTSDRSCPVAKRRTRSDRPALPWAESTNPAEAGARSLRTQQRARPDLAAPVIVPAVSTYEQGSSEGPAPEGASCTRCRLERCPAE